MAGLINPSLPALQSILPMPYFASERSFAQFRLSEEVRQHALGSQY